ncbi:MAG: hypothetical protein AAFN81_21310 [Bacteroidota bacterium]
MKVSGRFTHEGIQGFSFGYHPFTRPKMIAHLYFVDGLLIDTGQLPNFLQDGFLH